LAGFNEYERLKVPHFLKEECHNVHAGGQPSIPIPDIYDGIIYGGSVTKLRSEHRQLGGGYLASYQRLAEIGEGFLVGLLRLYFLNGPAELRRQVAEWTAVRNPFKAFR